jgi:hypothetical protein
VSCSPGFYLRAEEVIRKRHHSKTPPLANQLQRIYEGPRAGYPCSGETSSHQTFIHLNDVVGAIDRRAQLPPIIELCFPRSGPALISNEENYP